MGWSTPGQPAHAVTIACPACDGQAEFVPDFWMDPPCEGDGALQCNACGARRSHHVAWPRDAYYQIEHRGHVLWAWHRDHAEVLASYLAAPARVVLSETVYGDWLKRTPTVFMKGRNHAEVARKLTRLLDAAQ